MPTALDKAADFMYAKHNEKHGIKANWSVEHAHRYLRSLVEETGELAAAIKGKHEHPDTLELLQVNGISRNWLRAKGTTIPELVEALVLDDVKHPFGFNDNVVYCHVCNNACQRISDGWSAADAHVDPVNESRFLCHVCWLQCCEAIRTRQDLLKIFGRK